MKPMLKRMATLNPLVPEMDALADDASLLFMPLETVWETGRADFSRRALKADVSSGYTRFLSGDVLLPKITPTFEAGRVVVAQVETRVGVGTTELHVIRPRETLDARYLSYLLRSSAFLQEGATTLQGVGNLRRVPASWLEKFRVPVDGIESQVAIADFLDRETAKIDALINKQQRMLEALQERSFRARDAALGSLVGKGQRSRWLFRECDIRAGEQLAGLPLMSVSIDWGVRRRDEVTEDLSRADDLRNYKVARAGDIVINRMRAFQGALGVAPEDGLVSPDYAVLRAAQSVDAVWLTELMKTAPFVSEMTSRLRGIGTIEGGSVRTPRVSVDDIGQILVQAPSIECQRDQLRSLIGDRDGNMQLIAKVRRHVDLAQERRSALITAAVTGQLDIGGAA